MARALLVALLVLAVGSCRHAPVVGPTSGLSVAALHVAFPREEQGALSFEVELPEGVLRLATLRWELWLGARRFAEGVVMTPDIVTGPDGRRRARVEAPLVYRHLGWRDGSSWVEVGVRGDVQPFGVDEGARVAFRTRAELLLSGAPVLDVAE
jgi:hypothetical protein